MSQELFNIATGANIDTKIWKNKKTTWSNLVKKLSKPIVTSETLKEYSEMARNERHSIKSVGAFVGGYIRNGRRKPENILSRRILTLDIDFGYESLVEAVKLVFEYAFVIHSTHSYSKITPKFRFIVPLDREVTSEEYLAVSRKIASYIDINTFDATSFQVNRFMFWPSISKDAEYIFHENKGPFIKVDDVLNSYQDWTDVAQWPTTDKENKLLTVRKSKQEDPRNKKGIVGAFCRAYSITQVIEKYLPDIYELADEETGRYTYLKGSTSAGVLIYEDLFSYSHHNTDPAGGRLCNAFDLVRLSKFGHLDNTIDLADSKAKSYKMAEELALMDESVRILIAKETLTNTTYDFAEEYEDNSADLSEDDLQWTKGLEIDSKGVYKSTASNINLILSRDKRLVGCFKLNIFDNRQYVMRSLPWRLIKQPEVVKNVDYSGLRNYLETVYNIVSSFKIDDALALVFDRNSFHPIRDYLNSVKWDGQERVENLLIDYLGAEDNLYSKQAIRKTLVGAVARAFVPGIKFELVLTLVGEEGIGKSTLGAKLGRQWFSDSFNTIQGQQSFEQLQGAWIMEIPELSAMKKAEVETIKHYISKTEDTYRPAYGRVVETFKRSCIFIGTTNESTFLASTTGNRRFLPVDVNTENATKSIFTIPIEEVDQIWAEATCYYNLGENLYLSKEATELARIEQLEHTNLDGRIGMVQEFLAKKITKDWNTKGLYERREFYDDPLAPKGSIKRTEVCALEIWCELFGNSKKDFNRYKSRDINSMLRTIPGWKESKKVKRFSIYGTQRFFHK